MKKLGITLMMAAVAAIGLFSCTQNTESNEQAIANKIENKEALSADDYSVIIEYVGEYAKKAQKYVDMEINDANQAEVNAEMAKLNAEYPYLEAYRNCLKETPSESLTPENLEKVGEYAGLTEFSAPAGYTIQTDPEAAGLEEATPEVENGVVAGSVDSIKVENKNAW